MDGAQEDGLWRAIGALERATADDAERINALESRVAWHFWAGAAAGAMLTLTMVFWWLLRRGAGLWP